MKIYFQIHRHPKTKLIQLSIVNSDGEGYRISGPKFDGMSIPIETYEIKPSDVAEISLYLNQVEQ